MSNKHKSQTKAKSKAQNNEVIVSFNKGAGEKRAGYRDGAKSTECEFVVVQSGRKHKVSRGDLASVVETLCTSEDA